MSTDILWLSPTDFVTGDKSLRISYPSVAHPAVEIKTKTPGDLKWIYLGLRVPLDHDIHSIHVCYQLSNSRSFISQIRLAEMQAPDQAVVRHDDATDLLSTTPICYQSPVVPFRPGAAIMLALRLNFGNVVDTITLGAIGVEVFSSCQPVPSYMRGTLSAPGMPGCLARVTDSVRGLWMDQGSQWFSLSGEVVNVKEFGAKGDGITDDQPAFAAAIASFSPPNSSNGGVVEVPPGTYRLANTVLIKKCITIKGSHAGHGCTIKPDLGMTAFKFERYNTSTDLGNGAGDNSRLCDLNIYNPNHKATVWTRGETVAVGTRRKVGPPSQQGAIPFTDPSEYYRHYECTWVDVTVASGPVTAASGPGPRSLGNDQLLNYKGKSSAFTVGDFVYGATSKAFGRIIANTDNGVTGTLRLTSVSGTFQDNENLWSAVVYAVANSPSTVVDTDTALNYYKQSVNFVLGQYVAGQTSGAVGLIIADNDSGNTGQLLLSNVSGTFQNDENLKVRYALADGPSTAAAIDEADGDARWKYIGAGAGVHIRANGVVLQDVMVTGMSGCGVHVVGGDLEDPGAFTNSNSWQFYNLGVATCDGHGVYLRGSDTNGGTWLGGYCAGNGGPASDEDFSGPGFNLYDASFLGNTYIGVCFWAIGGQGSVFNNSIGGASSFIGCYQEGTGGGHNLFLTQGSLVVGGGMAYSDFRSSGLASGSDVWSAGANPTLASRANNFHFFIKGYNAPPWRPNVFIPKGIQRSNNVNIYECITAGTTAASGGPTGGPGTTNILDGTARWAFVAVTSAGDGTVGFGSRDPTIQTISHTQVSDDIGVGFGMYDRYEPNAGFVSNARIERYGFSGPAPALFDGNGVGMVRAQNKTVLAEWPSKIPAGKALFDMLWIGGCRVLFGTGLPTSGIFNPGDRIYYKGAACVAGGAEGLVCVTGGTLGTYGGGRTATANGTAVILLSGGAMSTLVDQQDFKVGDWISVDGAKRHVLSVGDNGLTLTLNDIVNTGSGLPLTFFAPVFKEFGSIAP